MKRFKKDANFSGIRKAEWPDSPEALQGITLDANGEVDTVMRLPEKDESAILASMDALGGRESWGYKPFAPGYDNIKPGLLVDKLMKNA